MTTKAKEIPCSSEIRSFCSSPAIPLRRRKKAQRIKAPDSPSSSAQVASPAEGNATKKVVRHSPQPALWQIVQKNIFCDGKEYWTGLAPRVCGRLSSDDADDEAADANAPRK